MNRGLTWFFHQIQCDLFGREILKNQKFRQLFFNTETSTVRFEMTLTLISNLNILK